MVQTQENDIWLSKAAKGLMKQKKKKRYIFFNRTIFLHHILNQSLVAGNANVVFIILQAASNINNNVACIT